MEQIFQAINVYFSFAAVVINAVFVILVLARTSRTTITLTFLGLCLAAIIWNFGIFMTYFGEQGFWHHFSRIGSPMLPALLFHFAHSLVRPVAGNVWIALAYILAGLLSISSLLAVFHPGGRLFVDSVFWNIYFLMVLYPFILGSLGILRGAMRNARPGEQRNRLRYFYWATIIGMLMGSADLLQIFRVPIPRLGHAGSVLYSSVIAIGIFKYRRAYDIIAQMQMKLEFLSEIAAGIAHELRNPLSSIRGAGKLLAAQLKPGSDPRTGEYLDIIREEVSRLDDILVNFQNMTRAQHIKKELISVNDVIRKTAQMAEVGELPLTITTDFSTPVPATQADAASLKQVFLNLIKNAAEACGENGKLTIRTTGSPQGLKITFLDNGCGIAEEIMDCLFEPFVTTKTSGIGMGLAICQKIIQAHDGRLEARNAAGGGAEVSIFLPA